LGGGDGGLLKELVDLPEGQKPAFVTMVDIDEVVMEGCAKFMPNVCGKYLKKENWNGPNYKIIAGCAIQYMKDCLVIIVQ
jgi:spermine synthase